LGDMDKKEFIKRYPHSIWWTDLTPSCRNRYRRLLIAGLAASKLKGLNVGILFYSGRLKKYTDIEE